MAGAAANTTVGGNSAFHNFNNDFAHIQDPNERRRLALAEIDRAPFGWYHVRVGVSSRVLRDMILTAARHVSSLVSDSSLTPTTSLLSTL